MIINILSQWFESRRNHKATLTGWLFYWVSAEIRMQMVGHNSEKIHNKYHGEFDREKLSDISRKILGK